MRNFFFSSCKAKSSKYSISEEVSSIWFELDDSGLTEVIDDGTGWTIELDPELVGSGAHTLRVEATYADGLRLIESLSFIGPPTWTHDIQPLHVEHCESCHGVDGFAHTMDDISTWETEFLQIMESTESGRMPYGSDKLPDAVIDLIRIWGNTGFLEN